MHEGPVLLVSGHVVYTPPVELDVASARDAITELEHLIDLHPYVAVDLSRVEFIDSSGLSALLFGHKRAASLGGAVALFGATDRALRLMAVTQLDQVFAVYPTAEEIPPWSSTPRQP